MLKPNPRNTHTAGAYRTRRILRAAGVSLVAWSLLPCVAAAVQVVDVRVGQHKGYTRLVFELDEPAGYRVVRPGKAAGSSQLEISLDAKTQPSRFAFRDGWIENLDVQALDGKVAASVLLRKPGLRLREMTLGKPFRVVIDVLAPPVPAVAEKKLPKKAVAEKKLPKKAVAAPPTPKTPPAKRASVAKAVDSAPTQPLASKPAPKEVAEAKATKSVTPAAVTAPKPSALQGETRRPSKFAPPQSELPPAPKAPEPAEEEEGFRWFYAYLALGGLLLVLAGVAYAASRGRSATSFDESDFEDLVPEPEASPFSALSSGSPVEGNEQETPLAGEEVEGADPADAGIPLVDAVAEPVVELEPPVDTGVESLPVLEGVPVEDPAEAGYELGSSVVMADVARVLKEIESRLSALEGRLDDFVEWKSRVEKQIGAQTEELRVQRAAIARTQRAVRQMSRPQPVEADMASEGSGADDGSSEG